MIAMMDIDRSGKLGFDEFKQLWVDLKNWRVRIQIPPILVTNLDNG